MPIVIPLIAFPTVGAAEGQARAVFGEEVTGSGL